MSAITRRDFDESHLASLEGVKNPTASQQGELTALRLTASDPTHQRRIERLDRAWKARRDHSVDQARRRAERERRGEAEYLR